MWKAAADFFIQKEYCPYIDSALFYAILSDYDLSEPASVKELRATLAVLKQSAEAQIDSAFDPSGTSGLEDSNTSQSSDRARSWHGDIKSEATDLSTLSHSHGTGSQNGSDITGIDDLKNLQYGTGSENLSNEEKTALLMEMFPTVKQFDVEFVLKKGGFQYGKAVEELLNQVFFEEESQGGDQIVKKGIDAFFDPETSKGRKSHGKKKRHNRGANSASSPMADPFVVVRGSWDRAKEEIDFIQQRTYLPRQTVSSAYHKAGASLAPTVAALCAASDSNPYLASTPQSVLQTHISELSSKFSSLSLSQATALVYISHPSTASAHELARILSTSQETSSAKITPHYLLRPPSPCSSAKGSSAAKPLTPLPASTASQLASAREIAFANASTAHRKSKSSPLMGGAASYYSSVGRETSELLRRHETAMAENLVNSQSKPGEVDLHGVRVQDGVRIAKEKAEWWWENEGREWAREGKVMEGRSGRKGAGAGTGASASASGGLLKIVTGVGRHSQGGKARLGPAVGAMLLKEGWKVEFGEGFLVVVGKMRK